MFVAVATPFTLVDIFQPKSLMKYKIQVNVRPTLYDIADATFIVFRNNLLQAAVMWSLGRYAPSVMNRVRYERELPSFMEVIRDMVGYVVVGDIFWYYMHRAMHHGSIYKYTHKKHHDFKAPFSMAGQYCTIWEHLFQNMGITLLPPILFKSHLFTALLFASSVVIGGAVGHCGYQLTPNENKIRFHDIHHEKFLYNYSLLVYLDYLHGTTSEEIGIYWTKPFAPHDMNDPTNTVLRKGGARNLGKLDEEGNEVGDGI